jgi:hypothetical protein
LSCTAIGGVCPKASYLKSFPFNLLMIIELIGDFLNRKRAFPMINLLNYLPDNSANFNAVVCEHEAVYFPRQSDGVRARLY